MTDSKLTIEYRLRVVRIGLLVSWAGMILLVAWATGLDTQNRNITRTALGIAVLGLAAISAVPWRRTLSSKAGEWIILVWSTAALLAILIYESGTPGSARGIGFLLVLGFAGGSLLPSQFVVALGVGASVAYATVLSEAGTAVFSTYATSLFVFAAAALLIVVFSIGIRHQVEATEDAYEAIAKRSEELSRKERELTRLYEVSRTIGAGSDLDEVLPELIGRVAEAVHARVGLVLLYNFDTERLELMSPIWVDGHTVAADALSLGLDELGISQSVFMSGDAQVVNDTSVGLVPDPLSSELEADRIAVVAMTIEHRTIGVLLVADKSTDFTDEDVETLESVAAPAALVLSQMAQFEEAKSTGERMAELAQLKTDFVSVVSHELRTPLTSIIGAISTLQRPELLPEDPRAQQLIEMAGKQANRLKTLIEDLLVMSRIDVDALPVRPEHITIESFLEELIAALPAGDRVVISIDPPSIALEADPDHLRRILTNLVDNALKYGDDDDILIQVVADDKEARLSVIDHGQGIPYEQRGVIFERFTQLQPHATRSRGGAGLGLSIVKGLVLAMDGRVWYEPTPGGGATFTVAFPSTVKDEAEI